jgi:uncharacterized protein (DUF2141 family)
MMNSLILRGIITGLVAGSALHAIAVTAQVPETKATACSASTAVRVHITGLKNGAGTVRVQAYGANPQDFLATGKWVRRVEIDPHGRRSLDVCLALPGFGTYAFAVRHDANANGKSDWNDGGGFSRNPALSLFHLKPAYADVAVAVSRDMPAIPIVMNYRQGFAIKPLPPVAAR